MEVLLGLEEHSESVFQIVLAYLEGFTNLDLQGNIIDDSMLVLSTMAENNQMEDIQDLLILAAMHRRSSVFHWDSVQANWAPYAY